MPGKKVKIDCLIFSESKEIIKNIEQKIQISKNHKEKLEWSYDIVEEIKSLLSCEKFDNKSPGCQYCRSFARLKKDNYHFLE